MKFTQLRSYRVHYLLNHRNDAFAVEDGKQKGYYLHRSMLIGESEPEVARQIIDLGGIPTSIKLVRSRSKLFSKLNTNYKEQFLRSIYFNCSGMSAAKALEAVIESDNSNVRPQLNPALEIIKRGGSFMESIDAINAFDDGCLAILEAGERTGTLKEAINTAVEYLKSGAATTKLMAGMGILAVAEIAMAVSSLLGNRFGVLPSILKSMPDNLPPEKIASLKAAVGNAYLVNDIMIWATIASFIVTAAGIYSYFDDDKKFRKWIDDRVQSIPALGETIQQSAVASTFRVAGSLLRGGVHLAVAMSIAEKSTRVPRVASYWMQAQVLAENGESVSRMLKQSLLDNSNQLLVSAHTNSQQLADAFFVISERGAELAKKSAKKFGLLLFVGMALYTALAVCISVYVMMLQNDTMMAGLKAQ